MNEPKILREEWNVADGKIVIEYPETISEKGLDDLQKRIFVLMRSIRRRRGAGDLGEIRVLKSSDVDRANAANLAASLAASTKKAER